MGEFGEKRREPRLPLHTPTVLHWRGENKSGAGTVSNMSRVGCYVLSHHPAVMDEILVLNIEGVAPEIHSKVRYIDEQVGMGVAFIKVTPEVEARIIEFVRAKVVQPV